jgi:hypothetical protein
MVEAFPEDTAPRYLLRDRDKIYGCEFEHRIRSMSIEEVLSSPASPWQRAHAERLIGSIRRDCLDHVIVLGDAHLRRILKAYLEYYHRSRTHLALGKDAPEPRIVQPPELGGVVELLRSAVSIIDTSGERRSHSRPVRPITHLTACSRFPQEHFAGEPTDPSFPRERSHPRTPFSRSSPKEHQAEEISRPRSSGEPQVLANDRILNWTRSFSGAFSEIEQFGKSEPNRKPLAPSSPSHVINRIGAFDVA